MYAFWSLVYNSLIYPLYKLLNNYRLLIFSIEQFFFASSVFYFSCGVFYLPYIVIFFGFFIWSEWHFCPNLAAKLTQSIADSLSEFSVARFRVRFVFNL